MRSHLMWTTNKTSVMRFMKRKVITDDDKSLRYVSNFCSFVQIEKWWLRKHLYWFEAQRKGISIMGRVNVLNTSNKASDQLEGEKSRRRLSKIWIHWIRGKNGIEWEINERERNILFVVIRKSRIYWIYTVLSPCVGLLITPLANFHFFHFPTDETL